MELSVGSYLNLAHILEYPPSPPTWGIKSTVFVVSYISIQIFG